jgi:PleD family two-component response regulator
MTRAIVYDRCIDTARATCAKLRRSRITAVAVHPTDFDRTFEAEGMPHVIVTELAMPMFSGFELIRQVRADWSRAELPIIAFTTADDALAWAEAKEVGADDVVVKAGPDPIQRLSAAIARCVGKGESSPNPMAIRPTGVFARLFYRTPTAAAA